MNGNQRTREGTMARGGGPKNRTGMTISPVSKARFERLASSRVIRFSKEGSAKGALWPVKCPTDDRACVDLLQDGEGRLYLTRTSRDGFVEGWRLLGANGKSLRVSRKHRPPPDR